MPVYTIAGRRILFVHVPKTGGMAISAALQQAGDMRFDAALRQGGHRFQPRHAAADTITSLYDPDWFDFIFLVVRDPVARAVSEYRYQRRKSGLHLARLTGFDTWLARALSRSAKDPSYRDNHFRPQTDFLLPQAQVFRYEDGLSAPLDALSALTGLDLTARLALRNPSPEPPFTPSDRSLDRLATAYRRDFETFGYPRPRP